MLLSFTIENWMSFRDSVTFSMIATRERQHGERVPKTRKYGARVLPIAALYGGNASGKSNFFEALRFAQQRVTRAWEPEEAIPVRPYRLNAEGAQRPCRFSFELLIDEVIYEFSFAMTGDAVVEEQLVVVAKSTEKTLYTRSKGAKSIDKSLPNREFLAFAFAGTRDNQLFLSNSISQGVETFRPVHKWFERSLTLVTPHARYNPIDRVFDNENPLSLSANNLISRLDTGIARLGFEEVPLDSLKLTSEAKEFLKAALHGKKVSRLPGGETWVILRNGELVARKLSTFHSGEDGIEVNLGMSLESEGTQRVIHLLPAFLDLTKTDSQRVYVIDEVDRSLHTLLTRRLIEEYLGCCSSDTRAQLLMTTHDVTLMDQQLFRRDEMWVAQRDAEGASKLVPFSDYKDVRYDKDVRKSYLEGRLGGVPKLLVGSERRRSRPLKMTESDD